VNKYRDNEPFVKTKRPYIVQVTYHKLYNILGKLSAIFTLALKSNTHPWLRVVHVGISVILNGRCHT